MSEPPAQGGEWRPLANEIAAHVKDFVDGVDALARGGGDETVPMLLLEVSQILLAGAQLGASRDVILPGNWEPEVGEDPDLDTMRTGLALRLADCDEYGNLDPADVSRRITHRTFAVAVTHLWGMPADVTALRVLADEHEILLLEDGSHAHGASVHGKKVGTFGHGAAFSMNGPKPLSAGEGGFVLTDDDDTYHRVLLHGQYNKRCRNEIPKDHRLYPYAVTGMGLKHRIHPLAASVALDQLDHLDDYIEGRQKTARAIAEGLEGVPGIRVVKPDKDRVASWYGLILQYQPDELDGLPIGRYFEAVQAEGCHEADRPGSTCPLNLLPLFQETEALFPGHVRDLGYGLGDFPGAEEFHARSIKLPVWHREEDLPLARQYVEAFRKVSANYRNLLG